MVDSRGMKTFSVRLTPEQHKKLKILAAYQETNVRDLVLSWLDEAWQEHEGKITTGGKEK